jgi:hypothetical protein
MFSQHLDFIPLHENEHFSIFFGATLSSKQACISAKKIKKEEAAQCCPHPKNGCPKP